MAIAEDSRPDSFKRGTEEGSGDKTHGLTIIKTAYEAPEPEKQHELPRVDHKLLAAAKEESHPAEVGLTLIRKEDDVEVVYQVANLFDVARLEW